MRAKLAQIMATPASASPPAISFQLRELGLVNEVDLEIIDAEGGGMLLGAHVDVSTHGRLRIRINPCLGTPQGVGPLGVS